MKGIRDPFDAGAQMLEKALPDSVSATINELNNWLANRGVPLEPIGEGGLSEQLREQEAAYQKSRGDTGFDWPRLGGNMLSPANLVIASRVPQAAGFGGRLATGIGAGAGFGLMSQPAYGPDENFLSQKGTQASLGAAAGPLSMAASNMASRMISPRASVNPSVQILDEAGVTMTPGQRAGPGSAFKKAEDAWTSMPFLGSRIESARREGYEEFNQATLDRALEPIGKRVPANMDSQQALAWTRARLSDAYDEVLPKMTGQMDNEFVSDITNIMRMADELPARERDMINAILQRELGTRATTSGRMSGESVKKVQQGLRTQAEKYAGSTDAYQAQVSDAINAADEAFTKMLQRNNPDIADELSRVNYGYANFKRAQRAATSVAMEDGTFTPAMLHNAVKALDKTKDKRAFSEGDALLQDLSAAGKAVLPNKVPESGTSLRFMHANPLTAAVAMPVGLGLSAAYTKPGMSVINTLLGTRPAGSDVVADLVGRSNAYAIPPITGGLNSVFGDRR